jgi:hypothetical protein
MRRIALAAPLAVGLVLATSMTANASINYQLTNVGIFNYATSTNNLAIQDLKQGNYLYVHYRYTFDVCGSYLDACEPTSWSTLYANRAEPHTEDHLLSPGSYHYVLLKFCQDDTAGDTCSRWKRVAA